MNEAELIKAFGAFFAIMNPFVNLPIFLAMTDGFSASEQRGLAIRITFYSALMCAVILLAGSQLIGFFGITVDEFRIAGGAVLAHIAWSMLNGSDAPSHYGSTSERSAATELSSLAFYPITFPMIVGPGTIATLIIYAGQAQGAAGLLGIALVVAAILAMLFLVLFFAGALGAHLTRTMRVIMIRLMGMILLAIAVSMLIDGLRAVLPGLA